MTAKQAMTISRLAKQAGVGVETIRYYQRLGLIEAPPRPATGYRVYPTRTLERLYFILRAKQLGFSLAEITELLKLDGADCSQTRELAEHKLELIKAKIRDLTSMTGVLEHMVEACRTRDQAADCPIIQSLSKAP
jgi:MerR family mercuric resistance operon transcriptional regulator